MIVNSYATLSDFKNYLSVRGQSTNMNTDAVDDVQIAEILEAVSRYVDDRTHRTFYPRYETRYVSVPEGQNNLRTLYLDDDLLAAVTVTNGDTEVVASTEYNLLSKNYNPKWGIQILQTANVGWNATVAGSPDYSISILGWWGFHNQYSQRGWSVLDTLAVADTTATGLTFTVTTGTTLLANQLIKIDNEIMNVASATTTPTKTVTVNQRGDNGSTAATHLILAPIYVWNTQPEIREVVKSIAQSIYWSRSGQTSGGKVTITSAGIVIRPEDVPPLAQQIIAGFTRPL
jgi:hypothetical protein